MTVRVRHANMSDGSCSSCRQKADYWIRLDNLNIRLCAPCHALMNEFILQLPKLCPTCGKP